MLTKEQFLLENPLLITVEEQDLAYQNYIDSFNAEEERVEAERLAAEQAELERQNLIASLRARVEVVIKGDVGHPAIRAVLPDCNNFAYDFEQIVKFGDLTSFVTELEAAGVIANAKMAQDKLNEESLKYLSDTDWIVTRFSETGVAIPQEVLVLRAAARLAIVG